MIALIISIIVMLILASVSISAIVGEDGILTQAQGASIMSRYARYLEEFQMNKVDAMIEQGLDADLAVNILGTEPEFLRFVPSIIEDDKAKFEIMAGNLVYTGSDSQEENIAKNTGMFSQYDQALYDIIGKEFEMYILAVEDAKASGAIPTSIAGLRTATYEQINNCLPSGKKIPAKYKNEFILSTGTLTYTGTNEERLILLSTSSILAQYIRPVSGAPKLLLSNYVAPIGGNVNNTTSTVDGKTVYKVQTSDGNYWTVRVDSQSGSIRYGTIIAYEGVGGTITIPDRLDVSSVGIITVTAVEGKGNGSGASRTFTHNIFQNDSGTSTVSSNIIQVIVAKGVYQIKNYALANLGSNKPFQILHDGADLDLDEGTGIEGSCGSYTFVAPTAGTYTLKCWGASGAGWDKINAKAHNWGSNAGYGGYSEGKITLNAGEKLYVNIGGKGLASFEVSSDLSLGTSNGSGGYNGGGNLPRTEVSAGYNNAGGGCTDIRFWGSTIYNQILVAGGGGGVDDFSVDYITGAATGPWCRNLITSHNDGSGGYGGGTCSSTDKTTWSGGLGFINGVIENNVDNVILGLKKINSRTFTAQMEWKDGFSLGGIWLYENGIYTCYGYQRLKGEDSALGNNYGAGGGGYYGGTRAIHSEGGGGGGSAYADTTLLTDITGYSDHETLTRSDGTEVQGPMLQSEIPQVTYYGRQKDALTYGNGYVAIEKN